MSDPTGAWCRWRGGRRSHGALVLADAFLQNLGETRSRKCGGILTTMQTNRRVLKPPRPRPRDAATAVCGRRFIRLSNMATRSWRSRAHRSRNSMRVRRAAEDMLHRCTRHRAWDWRRRNRVEHADCGGGCHGREKSRAKIVLADRKSFTRRGSREEEGCLSIPDFAVRNASQFVTIKAQNARARN